jgi:hypothetical protein
MGLLNGLMQGEWSPNGMGGQPDKMSGLLNNPALQMGLGILANNQGNYGSFGAALGRGGLTGMQNLQRQQESMRQQDLINMQRKRIESENQQREAQKNALGSIATEYGLDPNVLSAFPSVGEGVIKDKLIPKPKKLAFAPNGVAYDENNPEITIGENYGKPDTASNSSLAKMISEMNALPPNSPLRSVYKQAINKETSFAPPMVVQNYPAPMAAINPMTGQQELIQFGNKGDARPTGFKPVPENLNKAPTEGQAKAATFYSQMTSASDELNNLTQGGGYDPNTLKGQIGTSLATGITNPLAGAGAQKARQAQNQWAESFLRVKTGAAATKDEVKMNVETFFPKLGDSAEVIEQKARMRSQAENDVAQMTQNPNAILSMGSKMPEKTSQVFNDLPKPNQFKGKIIRDDVTGKRFQSNGLQWKEVK